MQTASTPTEHKTQLQSYFNGVGFDRWSAIYGSEPVSRIRRTVREGHELMLDQAIDWLDSANRPESTVLDAGCGTGLFSLRMAERGSQVTAIDIAPRMAAATGAAAQQAGLQDRITATAGDLGKVDGQYDVVACFDVLVHYPQAGFINLCQTLAQCTTQTLLITYAPHSELLALLHWIGGHFPQGQRRTEIKMIRDQIVTETLQNAGLHVKRTTSISHGFYHVKLLEAQRL